MVSYPGHLGILEAVDLGHPVALDLHIRGAEDHSPLFHVPVGHSLLVHLVEVHLPFHVRQSHHAHDSLWEASHPYPVN